MYNPEFLITSLIVVLLPGTGVIYTVSTGLFCGRRESIGAAIGCTAGIIPHLTASILGLSAILHVSAVAFQALPLALGPSVIVALDPLAYRCQLASWREPRPPARTAGAAAPFRCDPNREY